MFRRRSPIWAGRRILPENLRFPVCILSLNCHQIASILSQRDAKLRAMTLPSPATFRFRPVRADHHRVGRLFALAAVFAVFAGPAKSASAQSIITPSEVLAGGSSTTGPASTVTLLGLTSTVRTEPDQGNYSNRRPATSESGRFAALLGIIAILLTWMKQKTQWTELRE